MKPYYTVLTFVLQLILLFPPTSFGQFKNVKSLGPVQEQGELPRQLFGLTIDRVTGEKIRETIIEQLEFIKASNPNAAPPIVRVVLDVDGADKTGVVDTAYVSLIQEIKRKNLAFVMAEILDSSYIHYCTKKTGADADKNCVLERTQKYYEALKTDVDIWEVGNEVNGQWAGGTSGELDGGDAFTQKKQAARKNARESVTRQVEAAYSFLEGKGKKTAITFYFNDDGERHSWSDRLDDPEYSMLKWLNSYKDKFPDVDYVFISYWADDNFANVPAGGGRTRITPTAEKWAAIFKQIKDDYKKAQVGFGEVGAQCKYRKNDSSCTVLEDSKKSQCKDRKCDCCLSAQKDYAREYYDVLNSKIRETLATKYSPNYEQAFVGGYFYWQFNSDVINKLAAAKKETDLKKKQKIEAPAIATRQVLIDAYKGWK